MEDRKSEIEDINKGIAIKLNMGKKPNEAEMTV